MSCYHPFIFQKLGINPETGKNRMLFVRNFTGKYEDYDDKKFVLVPCGQCLGCRLDYAKVWAERCCYEASLYENNMFITLTYSDEFVPLKCSKDDLDKFIKRLRHFFNQKIRFFACCERGEVNNRPHFHLIVFNAMFDDIVFLKKNFNGDILYTSESLNKLWPYGFSTVAHCTYKTANYTARYVLKKQKGLKETDEFLSMSRKPGIGYQYLLNKKDEILLDKMIYFSFDENRKTAAIPKYFKKLINADELDEIAINRIKAKNESDKQLYNVDRLSDLNMKKESLKKTSIKGLKRGL